MMAYQSEMDLTNFQEKHPNTVLYASPDILMREAINIRYHSGMPVPLVREGRLVGVVGGNEIYHGLLRLQDT